MLCRIGSANERLAPTLVLPSWQRTHRHPSQRRLLTIWDAVGATTPHSLPSAVPHLVPHQLKPLKRLLQLPPKDVVSPWPQLRSPNYIMPETNSRYIFICKYICIYVKVSVCIGLYLNAAAWHCHTFFAIYPNPTSCKPCFWSPKRKKSSFWSEKAIYQACWLSWARKQFKVCHLNVPSQCAINSEYVLLKMA